MLPCVRRINPAYTHIFAGGGFTSSRPLRIEGANNELTVAVTPRPRGLRIGGGVVTAAGGGLLGAGVAVLVVQSLFGSRVGPGDEVLAPPDYRAGIAVFVSGAVILAGGIVMVVLGRTRVRVAPRSLGLLRPLRFG